MTISPRNLVQFQNREAVFWRFKPVDSDHWKSDSPRLEHPAQCVATEGTEIPATRPTSWVQQQWPQADMSLHRCRQISCYACYFLLIGNSTANFLLCVQISCYASSLPAARGKYSDGSVVHSLWLWSLSKHFAAHQRSYAGMQFARKIGSGTRFPLAKIPSSCAQSKHDLWLFGW